jgi:hypothetical protein
MNDDLAVNSHPHADQRNWQPGDDDDLSARVSKSSITTTSAHRTLDRLLELTHIPPEALADSILPSRERLREECLRQGLSPELIAKMPPRIHPLVRIDQLVGAAMYLQKVAACIGKKMEWKCAECGEDIWHKDDVLRQTREIRRARRDALYCSQACPGNESAIAD